MKPAGRASNQRFGLLVSTILSRAKLRAVVSFLLLTLLCPLALSQHRRAAAAGANTEPAPLKGVVISFHGTLQELSKKSLLLAADDNKLVTMRRSSKTKYFSGDKEIKAGEVFVNDVVSVDASEDNDLKFLAVTIRLDAVQPARKDRALITR